MMWRSVTNQLRAARRPHRRRARLTAVAAALGAAVLVTPMGTPVAQAAVPAFHHVHFLLDAATQADDGCSAAFPDPGDHQCSGDFASVSDPDPFTGVVAEASWSRADASAPVNLSFTGFDASLAGVVTDPSSSSFTVTSGWAAWAKSMTTPDEPGVAAGDQGGPLALKVTGSCSQPATLPCPYTFEVTGWVLATEPDPAPAPNGDEWVEFNMYLDATGDTALDEPCRRPDTIYTCEGDYQDHRGTTATLWPFNGGHGTANFGGPSWDGPKVMNFYRVGANILGSHSLHDAQVPLPDFRIGDMLGGFHVDSMAVPWGTNVRSPSYPTSSLGQQGGDLSVEVKHWQGWTISSYGFTFNVHGWVLRATTGPHGNVTTTSASQPETLSTDPQSTTVAAPVTVTPRFTG